MTQNLRCILLDDEIPGLTYLKMLCESIEGIEVVRAFNDPLVLLKEYANLEFDFYISDIEMPHINGLELATVLNKHPVIFVTAYKQYAVDAFDMDAIDYLSKPVQKARLEQAISKLRKFLHTKPAKQDFIQLQSNMGKAIIYFSQLLYIRNAEVDSRDKLAYFEDKSTLVLKNITFEKLGNLIPKNQFVRINKTTVIAIRMIKYYTAEDVTTSLLDENGKPISFSLSEIYRKDFLQVIVSNK